MKTLGINIDGVIRDFYAQFDKQYRKAFINNPNLVGMNEDMTVKEMTEEELGELEERIKLREKELISLPLDSYDLINHYRFEAKTALDGETKLSPEEALQEFIESKPFQIYAHAEEYLGACDAVNRIQAYGLSNNLYKTVFITKLSSPAIPATFHFLAKNASRIRNIIFIDGEESEKWNHCDVLIDCVPEAIQSKPDDKTIIKIEHPFNQWDETEHSFKSIKEINPNFIEELLVGEKKS